MSITLYMRVNSAYPKTKIVHHGVDNHESVPTGMWTLGVVGGAETCPEEESAYIGVSRKVGARIKTIMGEKPLIAKLVIDGDFDDLDEMVFCPNCDAELVLDEDGWCSRCGWEEGEPLDEEIIKGEKLQ
jgi:hypothetical protein